MGTGDASTVGHVASATGGSAWKTIRSGPCNRARIDMHLTVPFRSLAAVWPDRPVRADRARSSSRLQPTRNADPAPEHPYDEMVMKRGPAGDTVETVNSTSTEEARRDVVRRIGPIAKEARRACAAR